MRSRIAKRWACAFCGMLLIAGPVARGGTLQFTLMSPEDLSHLTPGQSADVNVVLSGLSSGEQLVSLTGGISYDASVLFAPASVKAGAIVPSPLNAPADFQTTTSPTEAHAIFLTASTLAAENITSNGVFYSFQITAANAGAGSIRLDPLALIAEQFDPVTPDAPSLRMVDAGPPLDFVVTAPEPGAAPLLAVAAVALLCLRPRRSRA